MMPQSILPILPQAVDSVASLVEGLAGSLAEAPLGSGVLRNLILSVLLIAFAVLGRRLVLRVVDRRIDDPRARYRWSKASSYVAFSTVAVFVIAIWLEAGTQLGTFLGLIGAGLAIALKDPVSDLAGWIFILWRRPFDLGDRLQIGEHAGDVVDIRLFQFTILEIGNWVAADQSTGRIIHVPNARVFTEPLANYTAQFDFLWTEIPVLVTFESDWKRAKALLEEVAREHAAGVSEEAERDLRRASRKFLIFYQKLTPVVYTSVENSGVLLTIRYLCKPRQRRGTAQAIWESVLDAFAAEPSVELAYPTYRAYLDPPFRAP
jgi:small-conductance mechanosensitive channel